ncbi:hypothetical protein [Mycolicibacterium porcinum]|uniref:hypothetical protein n=1 Tax=Mycolicibacterium porcinum TaxID=39693 RepID=UPI00084894EF|nr:hypothetical protein [Mycolicibacterium porcinum]ODR22122.1 hypothetical protein BHQ19_19795 [Mycolicibacterium porcinum]
MPYAAGSLNQGSGPAVYAAVLAAHETEVALLRDQKFPIPGPLLARLRGLKNGEMVDTVPEWYLPDAVRWSVAREGSRVVVTVDPVDGVVGVVTETPLDLADEFGI